MDKNALYMLTATEALAKMRSGELRAEELLDQCLNRMKAFDVDAWVENASELANTLALLRIRGAGAEYSPYPRELAGIPIGVKDIIDVAGWPTRGASSTTSLKSVLRDAPVVAKLREAGATILGKTVTCQFACFDPAPTKNPWKFSRTPGGSSAGSAAAVALGQCAIALGTQTGGSIIRPASYCGVCGFKPAHDRQWLEGVLPVSSKLDHVGPIARCVSDLELAWRVIAGQPQTRGGPSIPRFGVLRDYFWERASDDVRDLTDAAIRQLAAAGAQVVEVPLPPDFVDVHSAHRTIMAFDVARQHIATFKQKPHAFGRKLALLIGEGLKISPTRFAQAVAKQQHFREQLQVAYPDIDALVMPATASTAPTPETTGDASFNVPWSFAGVPAVCFPIGLAEDGMPCGMQLVRPQVTREDEFALLALARWCEATLNVNLWPELNRRLQREMQPFFNRDVL